MSKQARRLSSNFAQTWSDLLAYAEEARASHRLIPSMGGRGGTYVADAGPDGIRLIARRRGANPEGRILTRDLMEDIWTALTEQGFDVASNHRGRFHQAWWMIYVDAFEGLTLDVIDGEWALLWDAAGNQTGGADEEEPLVRERRAKARPPKVNEALLRQLQFDPSDLERGLRAHWEVEEALSRLIAERGFTPLEPTGEPRFDIAWKDGGAFHVVEVKSLTNANESVQLRLGLGQVLHYRHLIAERGDFGPVRAVLAVECEPRDRAWYQICSGVNVALVVGPHFKGLFPE